LDEHWKGFKKITERVCGFLWVAVPLTILNKFPEDANIAYLIFGVPLWMMIIYTIFWNIKKRISNKKDGKEEDVNV